MQKFGVFYGFPSGSIRGLRQTDCLDHARQRSVCHLYLERIVCRSRRKNPRRRCASKNKPSKIGWKNLRPELSRGFKFFQDPFWTRKEAVMRGNPFPQTMRRQKSSFSAKFFGILKTLLERRVLSGARGRASEGIAFCRPWGGAPKGTDLNQAPKAEPRKRTADSRL